MSDTPTASAPVVEPSTPPAVPLSPSQVEARRQDDKATRISNAIAKLESADTPDAPVEEPTAPPVEEPKKEEPKKEEPKKESPKVAVLRRREEEIAKKESALEAKELEASEALKAIQNFKRDPLTALKAAGMTFQDLADVVIAQSKIPDPVKQQMMELEKKLESLSTAKEEEDTRRKKEVSAKEDEFVKTALADFDNRLVSFLDNNKSDYELILATDNRGLVHEIMQEYYNTHGEFLDAVLACKSAEKYLEERLEKASKTNKFSSKFSPQSAQKEQKTLSSSMGTGTTSSNDTKNLSERDRLARAASLIRFDD